MEGGYEKMKKKNKGSSSIDQKLQAIELLLTTNLTQGEIAKKVGVHFNTITNWKKDKDFIRMKKEAVDYNLQDISIEAFKTMKELLKSGDPNIRFRASKDLLDRAGYKPVDRTELSGNLNKTRPFEDLSDEEVKEALNEVMNISEEKTDEDE